MSVLMSVLAVISIIIAIVVPTLLFIRGKKIDVLAAPHTFKFLSKPSSSVKDLEADREALRAVKEEIDMKIADAETHSKITPSKIERWKKDVEKIVTDIGEFVNKHKQDGDDSDESGFSWAMIPVAVEYTEYHQRAKDLVKDGDEISVAMKSGPDRFATTYEVQGSLELKYKKVLDFLKHDNSVNVIGIWGMGGVGKTTLLKKIYHSCIGLREFKKFQHVIYITASSEHSTVSKLQSEIVKKLKVNGNGDPDTTINNCLRNKNFILFIDNLWEAVELTKVGVPDTSSTGQYIRKVVIATRKKNVCANMDAREIIEVKCLDPTQSLILFTEKAGHKVIHSHPLIPELAENIARECKGLPLALKTIGRAMSKKSNIDSWRNTLDQLKNSQGLQDLDTDKKLLPLLKISYDNLENNELRNCFLTISIWPEDQIIDPKEIIEFWMGIDLIDNFESKYKLYWYGHSLIESLQDACLLEDVEYDGYYYSKFVKMHDVLRDLALWLVSDCGENKNKWMVKAGIQLQKSSNMKVKWGEAECISLIGSNIQMLPLDIPSCPSLLTLVLKYNRLIGKSTFYKFQSLTHLDLSKNSLESFPGSICNLTKLRYLNLSSNEITDVPKRLRNLKVLKYLILRDNWIKDIPKGVFAELSELLVLDLFRAIDTSMYPSVDVEELRSIQNKLLSFGTSVKTEEELKKLMLLSELPIDDLCIEGLHSRTFLFMSMIRNPHRLKELFIEHSDGGSEISLRSRTFHFMTTSKNSRGLKEIFIEISDGGSEINDGGSEMSDGGSMEIVFDKNETDQDIASLNLEFLKLDGLNELKRIIWKDIAPEILFAVLRKVQIYYCSRLEDITWVVNLPSLQYLFIFHCDSMRVAFSFNNDVDPQVLTIPSLVRFDLDGMNKLEKISTHSVAFPQLKHMCITNCPLLKELPLELETTPKLRKIEGQNEWWEKVGWDDNYTSNHFKQFFNHIEIRC